MSSRNFAIAAVGALLAIAPARSATVMFQAELLPASEVPPVKDSGAGEAKATLDTVTHKLDYTLTFQGFTSPVTMAHFHGPAAAGVNAGVVVPLGNTPASPLSGSVTLTGPQQAQLMAGQWYANLHTTVHPKGAARGQMAKLN